MLVMFLAIHHLPSLYLVSNPFFFHRSVVVMLVSFGIGYTPALIVKGHAIGFPQFLAIDHNIFIGQRIGIVGIVGIIGRFNVEARLGLGIVDAGRSASDTVVMD